MRASPSSTPVPWCSCARGSFDAWPGRACWAARGVDLERGPVLLGSVGLVCDGWVGVSVRLVVILIAALWGVAAVLAFARTSDKPLDARLTAAYFLLWPVLAVVLFLNEPVPLWLGVPVLFGFLPWFLSGPHLWAVLRDPSMTRPDEIIGIPKAYWFWGGIGTVLLGLIFNRYA